MATKVINALTFGDTYVLTTPYATCSTAAGTAAKVATITPGSAFSLETGVRVSVKFTNALSVAAPTLNVNSSGAKAIYFRGATLSSAQYWASGSTVDFVFDGTYWQMLGSQHNSTYSLSSFGVTSTAAELNILDGVTATAAEINKLDGLTTSTTELNYVDGVTSNIQTQLNNKSDYITSLKCSCPDGTGGYIKICKIPMTTAYNDKTLEFTLASRSCKYEKVIVQLQTSTPATCVNTKILASGNGGNYYTVHGYKYNTGTAGSEYIEIWCTLPTWDTVNIFRSYFYSNNSDVITWYGERATTLPTTSTTTVKFNAELEKWSGSAANVAWSGVTSKPSYYDAKAIKGITRSGTTFTYTCMDGTTGTFSQQDNNTTYTFTNNAPTLAWGTTSTIGTVGGTALTVTMPSNPNTNTYGRSGDTSSKIYLIGTTTQSTGNKTTYSHDTAYVGTDGCLYSGGTKVLTSHQAVSNSAPTLAWGTTSTVGTIGGTALTVTMPANPNSDTKVTQNAVITTSGSYPVILGNSTATTEVTGTVNKSSKLLFNPSTGNLSIGTSGTDGSGSITLEGSLTMGSSQTDSQGIMPRASNWNSLGMYNKYWYRAYVSTVYCGSIKTLSGGTFSFPATITWNTF